MGAQQVKEGRGSGGGTGGCAAVTSSTVGNIGSGNIGPNIPNQICTAPSGSVSSNSTFGAGSSIRASRMSKSRTPKEAKIAGLNIFTEHNGKCNEVMRFLW